MDRKRVFASVCMVWFVLVAHTNVALAARPAKVTCPDFTQGDKIPEGWTHDWTLGPTGLRGWLYCDAHTTTDARQIKITKVDQGSPADGVLEVGDVILGVHGKLFDHDARILFGKAITEAEKTENQGKLPLTRWRNGKTEPVVIELQPMGSYSPTAPFNCSKSNKIREQACAALAKKMKANPTGGSLISRALNATLLLASGNPEYLPVVKEQARLLSQYNQSSGVITWNYGFVNIFLAEYVLATGDRTYVDEGLKRITKMAVDGQGLVGSYGHKFADLETKRLSGYGMMNSPGLLLTYSMVLAQRAGVDVPGLEKAIDKSTTFLKFYVGKGAIPYGDHNPWIETHDDNGKCGLATVLFDHQGNASATEFYSRMSVADHGVRRDEGHTGNYFNMTWALPGVVRCGPHASGAWIDEFGWYYDLARRWDGTFLYQGAPEPRPQVYDNWESTGSYLLGFMYPLKKTYLTGRKVSSAPQVSPAIAAGLIEDGRGWTNKDRTSAYDKMTVRELLQRLSSWSPTVRERTAMALARKRDNITPQLIGMLNTGDLYTKYGVCQAIKRQRGRAAAAVPALLSTFDSDDLWLRILSAEALAGIGEPAKAAVPELLKRLVKTDPQDDPRNMEQRYLSFALFNRRGGLLGRSLEGVDRELLIQGVRLGLRNEDGRARGSLASVYENLTFDELKPLLPDIYLAIKEQAPSDIMFSAEIRMAGLKLFAENHVSEGIELCVDYARHQRQHASEKRIDTIMDMLKMYGAHAQRVTDQLETVADYFEHEEKDFPRQLSLGKAKAVRKTIKAIKASTDKPRLITLPKGPRTVVPLDTDWQFIRKEVVGAEKSQTNTTGWEAVSVPHDWAIKGPFDKEIDRQVVRVTQDLEKIAKERTGRTGALPHIGVGWYRKTFTLPEFETGKKALLVFDGAMSDAHVYINGQKVGNWPFGYNYFYFDISEYLKEGENLLAVRLENLSFSSRWYPGAGIYRKVQIIVKDEVSFQQWGTFVTTPAISGGVARINIKSAVNGKNVRVVTEIRDADRKIVATDMSDTRVGNQIELNMAVANPKLWSPNSPYLYTAVSRLYQGAELKDEIVTRFGIRHVVFDPDKGMVLNGKVTKFKGVCLHHDLGPLGAAVNRSALKRQITIMKDMGCNAIRSSHNMPSHEQLELCDEMGILFLAETFDEWVKPKVKNGYNRWFKEWAEKDVVNLVRATRNHPCIVMWSSGNEVPDQHGEEGPKRAKWLQDIFHREDPTRPVTVGMDQVKAVMANGFGAVPDIPGLNYRVHLYEEAYKTFPQGLLLGSETASTVSSRGVYKFPVEKLNWKKWDDLQCSSYDVVCCSWSNLPEDDFVLQDDKDWVIGEFVWTGFDYLGEPTPYGLEWPSRSSYFGICDLGGLPKDRYYLYRSRWNTTEDTLHMLPHWNWEGREGEVTPIFVYTNHNSAELFVNGASQGIQKKNSDTKQNRYRLMWMDVTYQPGTVRVVAYDEDGKAVAEKEMHTAGKPHHLELSADRGDIVADGQDLSYVTVTVVDKNGIPCPTAANRLNVNVSGAGQFKAVCNGDATSLAMFHLPTMKAFSGKLVVLLQSLEKGGDIELEVTGNGLKAAKMTIVSR